MSRRMVNDVRFVSLKHLEDLPAVPHGSNNHLQIQVRILLPQFQLNVIGAVFIDIEDDQLLRMVGRNLPTQFRADAAAAAGDQHHLSLQILINFLQIHPDRLSAQQILHCHIPEGADLHLAGPELVHARQILQFTAGFLADLQNLPLGRDRGTGDSQIDLFNFIPAHAIGNAFPSTCHRDSVDIPSPFIGIVIDDAADGIPDLISVFNIPDQHLSCCSRTNHHHVAG